LVLQYKRGKIIYLETILYIMNEVEIEIINEMDMKIRALEDRVKELEKFKDIVKSGLMTVTKYSI